jgi:hypothetical protein
MPRATEHFHQRKPRTKMAPYTLKGVGVFEFRRSTRWSHGSTTNRLDVLVPKDQRDSPALCAGLQQQML